MDRKGFISLIGVIIIGLAIGSGVFFGSTHQKNKVMNMRIEIQQAEIEVLQQQLGASVSSTELSDTINTFRTNVNGSLIRINDELVNSTSVDPGHLHTTGGVSGTIAVANGGTGTSTGPTINGQLFISSTTDWTVGALTAGDGISITSSSGSITITNAASVTADTTMTLFGSSTLAQAEGIVSTTVSGTDNMRIIAALGSVSSSGIRRLRFNNFSGTEYAYILYENAVEDKAGGVSGIHMNLDLGGAITSSTYIIDVTWGATSLDKRVVINGVVATSSASAPDYISGGGIWSSSTPISSIEIDAGGGTFAVGSSIKVYGN
jgi:hypothetical protein